MQDMRSSLVHVDMFFTLSYEINGEQWDSTMVAVPNLYKIESLCVIQQYKVFDMRIALLNLVTLVYDSSPCQTNILLIWTFVESKGSH